MEIVLIIVGIIAAIVIASFVIGSAIGFIRTVSAEHDYRFFNLAMWAIIISLITVFVSMFTAMDEVLLNVVVLGLLGTALALNIHKLGFVKGVVFSVLQFATVYAAIIVLILYSIFKGVKSNGE